ncbi:MULTISPECIES: 5'/3'-nucleotidase SurE [Pseudomonas]|uniref:5'/3'-nucleotidase SurE n=1 Tax=Pseudomonas TaxID=286 RepID=UPI0007B32B85|nr:MULTISPECIES: 5'/3'-nucleotidase SurE [Pseudomonas]AVO60145.1 5'/3'-nucleotidase SurE [Pseudomonas chlororaphis subsp. piscium]AZC51960.1 5'-nucleotidase SurE [Pseudomonas chlororaphis subsp. piscium]AZC58400.1 5'-nucleotidase SurE [Pseudomonas chlororaphis subsp. piscium]AZC64626.1 5'-nucleotidase SurE [Pseudomonas chlororaphis subsp. piscium]AZC70866.1 5'-nucleotidase SurE [Pseudomonas chlororaphis subsp. piscium]
MANDHPRFARILLTNDDGIDAPGLKILERIAGQLAREVWVVAPLLDQSGTSHSLSLHTPLRLSCHGQRRFAVTGTPGDCVAMALGHLLNHDRPDLILSGVNRGANLGVETVFSGTVGGAMTGLLFGVPAIALSQAFTDRSTVPWDNALNHGPQAITQLMDMNWPEDVCLNVNFPDCAPDAVLPLKLTRQGSGRLNGVSVRTENDPRGLEYHWLKLDRHTQADEPGTETAELLAGHITVTPLQFERTHDKALFSFEQQNRGSLVG